MPNQVMIFIYFVHVWHCLHFQPMSTLNWSSWLPVLWLYYIMALYTDDTRLVFQVLLILDFTHGLQLLETLIISVVHVTMSFGQFSLQSWTTQTPLLPQCRGELMESSVYTHYLHSPIVGVYRSRQDILSSEHDCQKHSSCHAHCLEWITQPNYPFMEFNTIFLVL